MNRIKMLRNKKAALVKQSQAMLEAAGDNSLSADDQVKFDANMLEIEGIEANIAAAEKLAAAEKAMEPARGTMGTFADDAKITVGEDATKKYANLGDMLADVAKMAMTGEVSERLQYEAAATGQNTTVNSEGGFLVRKEFSLALLEAGQEESQLLPYVTKIPVGDGFDGVELPYVDDISRADGSRNGGVRVYRKNEADTVSSSKVKLSQKELKLEDLMALCYTTERQLQDGVALQGIIQSAFKNEFAFTVDNEIIRGSGAGQMLGILNSDALISVAKETGQDADTIVFDNVKNMRARLRARNRANAIWLVNQECEPQLQSMSQIIGTGGVPVYMPAGGIVDAPNDRLYGRPVINLEQCSALGDLGDILLADLSDYLVIEKGGLVTDSSMHVRFLYDEMAFRFKYRINGAPKTRKPLTPFKGTNTLSPYVGLAARA